MSAPATEKQRNFLLSLARAREVPSLGATPEERVQHMQARLDDAQPDVAEASRWIDHIRNYPPVEQAAVMLAVGLYEKDGEVYVVKPNQAKTQIYAKRLVQIGGRRLTEAGTVVKIEFEYAPGAVRKLTPADRMDPARAQELSIRYGHCLVCGRKLKDATSVQRGIGPICWGYMS